VIPVVFLYLKFTVIISFDKLSLDMEKNELIKMGAANLLTLSLELSSFCNHRCLFCSQHLDKQEKHKFMDIDTVEEVLKALEIKKVDNITPFGLGESTLHPYFFDIISEFLRQNKNRRLFNDMVLNTNSVLFTKELSERLLTSIKQGKLTNTFHRIHFSIDASSAATYKVVHGKDDYTKVMENIIYFLKLRAKLKMKKPLVTFAIVVCKENSKEITEFVKFFIKLSQKFFFEIEIYTSWPEHNKNAIYIRKNDIMGEYLIYKKAILELKKAGYRIKENTYYRHLGIKGCVNPFINIFIDAFSDVSLCCSFRKELKIGSLNHQSLWKIWQGTEAVKIREQHLKGENLIEVCEVCLRNL